MNIQEHIIAAIEGDINSYEYLINSFQAYTINYAFAILKDYQLAEDAAQETFILLYRNIKNLKNPSAFLSWLKKLTFTCCNRITRRKRLELSDIYDEIIVDENSLSGRLEREERLLLIHYSLNQLSEVQKETIMLYYFMNKSYADIAALLGITEAAVTNRLYTGKKKLKSIMLSTMEDYLEEIIMKREEFTKKVLEQVPNITTQDPRVQENFQFCGCLRAVMQYLNKPEYDFIYFAGVSGALFSNVWSYQPMWDYSESTVSHVTFDGRDDIIHSVFYSIGYECEIISKNEIQSNKKLYLRKIVESLNKGLPVLTYGIVGPPTCSLITGYDEDGDILIAWSAFQDGELGMPDGYEPCGYFRKRCGLDESYGLIFIGNETKPLTKQDTAEIAFKNIKKVMNLQKSDQYYYGTEAFNAWANAFLDDNYFTDNSEMLASYADVHCGMKVIVMTGCTYMSEFLNRLKQYDPAYTHLCDELLLLSDKEDKILRKFWELQPQFNFETDKLLDRSYRVQLAEIILAARDVYQQMTERINEYSRQV